MLFSPPNRLNQQMPAEKPQQARLLTAHVLRKNEGRASVPDLIASREAFNKEQKQL